MAQLQALGKLRLVLNPLCCLEFSPTNFMPFLIPSVPTKVPSSRKSSLFTPAYLPQLLCLASSSLIHVASFFCLFVCFLIF